MSSRPGTERVVRLFKALGNEARLDILTALEHGDLTVSGLVEATGMSQPLVSQHLRVLKTAHLVAGTRAGKEVVYSLADHHVAHAVGDAFTHVIEGDDHV